MIVMGLDLATNSGWAVRDSNRHRSSIECGVIDLSGHPWEEKYAIFSLNFLPLFRKYMPDFIAIERPEHGVRQFNKQGRPDLTGEAEQRMTINPGALQLTGITGAAISICSLMNRPYGLIAANSWRPIYFGKGFKPPLDKDGDSDWKAAAIEAAKREGIALPSTKKDQMDAAEAIGVCTCWHKTEIPQIPWMQQRFLELRTGTQQGRAA